ncbi:hypothetical protein BV898_19870 [Hypsibius exemplaris]|uniref:Reverse transcriptase domain-containing protein n=1 Tax=Hypsibius exemplaris TaxID=2072580 RepID=A0A9X6NLM9_HYPEX|nr:hypothetical protein BV898_19870 [Hypsibius exemplaris]
MFVDYVCRGLTDGFDLGYMGPQLPRMTPNARTAMMYPEVLRANITKEIALRHTVGPFDKPPLDNFVCSSLGVRPKKTGGARIIMDLSQPFGNSVNDYISKVDYTLHYCSIDDAVRTVNKLGTGALMAKLDVKYAFRLIPVQRKDWNLLGFAHDGKYYFDTVLPFGLRSSPAIFNQLADLLEWLVKVNGDCPDTLHYMDDFFIAGAPDTTDCNIAVSYLTALADDIGLPLAPEKTMGPTTTLPFLGIMIDSVKRTLSIPTEKVTDIIGEIQVFSNRKYATKREILSLVGGLAFATKCIPAGRIFLRRLLDLAHSVTQYHHRVKLGPSFRADLEWWLNFLPLWNGQHSFLDSEWSSAFDLHLYTDAAGTIGCGAAYGNHWFQIAWPAWVLALRPPIAWQEMVPVYLACLVWGKHWHSKRILFHSDNESVVAAWAKFSSSHKGIMDLIRRIYFLAATGNFAVQITHVAGVNSVADALSRFEMVSVSRAPTNCGPCRIDNCLRLNRTASRDGSSQSKRIQNLDHTTDKLVRAHLALSELHMELALDGSCVFA